MEPVYWYTAGLFTPLVILIAFWIGAALFMSFSETVFVYRCQKNHFPNEVLAYSITRRFGLFLRQWWRRLKNHLVGPGLQIESLVTESCDGKDRRGYKRRGWFGFTFETRA